MNQVTTDRIKELLHIRHDARHVICGREIQDICAALDELLAYRKARKEPVGEVIEQPGGLVMDGMVAVDKPYRNIKGLSAMKRLPLGTKFYTAPPADQWIALADQWPEDEAVILVADEEGIVWGAEVDHGKIYPDEWPGAGRFHGKEATHWMPMPERKKEKRHEHPGT